MIIFGPAGLGPAKTAEKVLEELAKKGIKACEIAFTYSVYLKKEDSIRIGKKAKELGIELTIHAPYFVNLNSEDPKKIIATKKRILDCCEAGHYLQAKLVVFHPGYYSDDEEKTYENIKLGIQDILKTIKEKQWNIEIAPETMGKVNVFGSIQEISRLAKETGCSFCIDFAHILARDKKVNYKEIEQLFPQKDWHVHFSGIIYGDKGEKSHKTTTKEEWKNLLSNLPKDRNIRIVNESPTMLEDTLEGIRLYSKS